jgi:hypothetical protein
LAKFSQNLAKLVESTQGNKFLNFLVKMTKICQKKTLVISMMLQLDVWWWWGRKSDQANNNLPWHIGLKMYRRRLP